MIFITHNDIHESLEAGTAQVGLDKGLGLESTSATQESYCLQISALTQTLNTVVNKEIPLFQLLIVSPMYNVILFQCSSLMSRPYPLTRKLVW